jgi:microcompartment protein CcmL/EutN
MTSRSLAVIVIEGDSANLHQALAEICDIAKSYGMITDLVIKNVDGEC